jgi:hypothetical protein
MSRAERRALVERTDPTLPVSQQCRLLAVSRSSVYRRPAEVSEEVDRPLTSSAAARFRPARDPLAATSGSGRPRHD